MHDNCDRWFWTVGKVHRDKETDKVQTLVEREKMNPMTADAHSFVAPHSLGIIGVSLI